MSTMSTAENAVLLAIGNGHGVERASQKPLGIIQIDGLADKNKATFQDEEQKLNKMRAPIDNKNIGDISPQFKSKANGTLDQIVESVKNTLKGKIENKLGQSGSNIDWQITVSKESL